MLKLPQDRLKDAHFLGVNWDIWDDEHTFAQVTLARAFNVTDGFNGLVVLPNNPVTGQPIGAPIVFRFTPSTNLGHLDLGSLVVLRKQGPLDIFASVSYDKSHPEPVSTPFGGFFFRPLRVGRVAHRHHVVRRPALPVQPGEDQARRRVQPRLEVLAQLRGGRGRHHRSQDGGARRRVRGLPDHRIHPKFIVKLGWIKYWYDYSLSGWQVGAPKKLDTTPVLGLPTYDRAGKLALSLTARF